MDVWLSYWDCSESDTWPCPAKLYSTCIWVIPDSVRDWGVYCHIYVMVHIKDHLWAIGFMPNHRVSNSPGVRWTGYDGKIQKVECVTWSRNTVCSPGSWDGRRWLPLTKDWHSQNSQNQRKGVNHHHIYGEDGAMGYNKEIWNENEMKYYPWCWLSLISKTIIIKDMF